MKKLLIIFIIACASLTGMAQYRCIPHLQEYGNPGNSYAPYNGYTNLNVNNTQVPVWSSVQHIWFPFYFNGQLVTDFKVSSTGVLTFDTLAATAPPINNNTLPDPQIPDKSICVRGIGALNNYSQIQMSQMFAYYGNTLDHQQWITLAYFSDTITTGYNRIVSWSIVLEENTNKIYIVDQAHWSPNPLHLTLGIQVDATSAYMAPGSPDITWHSINGSVYYEFTEGNALNTDGAIIASSVPEYASITDAPFTVRTKLRNLGADTIHSLQLHYAVNGGATNTQTLSGLNIPCGNFQWFNFTTLFNPATTGAYSLDTWVDNINGTIDEDTTNNHFIQQLYVASTLPPRRIMFEEFKGTGCLWSGYWTQRYDSIIGVNYNKASSIKYECYFPSVLGCPDCDVREQFYNHYGAPMAFANGEKLHNNPSLFLGCPWNATQPLIDSLYNLPGLFTIQPNLTLNGLSATVTGTVTSTVNMFAGTPCKIYVSLVEDTIRFATPQGNSGETLFVHTSRKLIPTGKGVFIGTPQLGHTDTLNYSYTITDTTINTSRLRVVVFVQDTVTREIYQCAEAAGTVACAPVYSVKKYDLCPQGDSVYINGNWIKQYGVYPVHYSWGNGCDSVQLNFVGFRYVNKYISSSYLNPSALYLHGSGYPNDTYTYQWYDSTYQQIIPGATDTFFSPTHYGLYYVNITNQLGCKYRTYTYHYNCSNSYNNNNYVTICTGDSIQISNFWYTTAGTYYDTLVNVGGCDSIIRTILSFATISTPSIYVSNNTAHSGNYCYWMDCNTGMMIPNAYGYTFNAPYTGDFKAVKISGQCRKESACVHLTSTCVDSLSQQTRTICNGLSTTVGNHTYSIAGTYIDTLINTNGCFNIVTTSVIVLNDTINATIIAHGDTLIATPGYANYCWYGYYSTPLQNSSNNKFIIPSSTSYSVTITDGNGCTKYFSSVYHVAGCVFMSGQKTIDICNGDSAYIGHHWYSTPGMYIDSLKKLGCDSLVYTTLNIINYNINTSVALSGDTLIAQPGYLNYSLIYCWNGNDLLLQNSTNNKLVVPYSGCFQVRIKDNITGCSSSSICQQIVKGCGTINTQQSITICSGDSVQVGNNWYLNVGTYTDALLTTAGCDSIVTTMLSTTIIDTSIVLSGDTLFANSGYSNYEWIECATGLSLSGTTGYFFIPPYSGIFKSVITDMNGCSSETSCIPFIITGISNSNSYPEIKLLPNPANENVTLISDANFKNASAQLTDLSGQILQSFSVNNSQTVVSLNDISVGIYYLKIYESNSLVAVRKLVVIK